MLLVIVIIPFLIVIIPEVCRESSVRLLFVYIMLVTKVEKEKFTST